MPKYLAKRAIWFGIVLVGLILVWQLFSAVGNLIVYFDQGADPETALNIVPNVPTDFHVDLQWRHDDPDTGRPMEDFTRTQIASAYMRSWLQWNLSLTKDAPYGLSTYFVGPALADLNTTITEDASLGYHIDQADTAHLLQLHTYAADGSIVSFTDQAATVVQIIRNKQGQIIYSGEQTATYDVVMFLEDGNWRIRHWVRTAESGQTNMHPSPDLHLPAHFIRRQGNRLMLDGVPYHIAGINYYPKESPWDRFWPDYQPTVIDHDFALIHNLGLNSIRIFVPFTQFGGADLGAPPTPGPTPTADPKAKKTSSTAVTQPLQELDDLLTRASKHHLSVIVTLFDFHADYSLLQWPDTDEQLRTLLTRFRNNPAILAWDLKNEPDLDYKQAGQVYVDSWLKHEARLAHQYDPHHLVTIGWSTPTAAQTHIPGVDLISFHYYGAANQLLSAFHAIEEKAPLQPIALTEFGLPTWNSFFFPNGHTPVEQAEYYADLLSALRRSDSAGYMAWTLYDFHYAPPTVAGGLPWQSAPQRQLGIITYTDQLKPAAHLLAPEANLHIPRAPAWEHLLKPFWLTLTVAALGLGSTTLLWRIRRAHR